MTTAPGRPVSPVSPSAAASLVAPVPPREEFARLKDAELVARYALGLENFERRIVELSDDQLDTAFLPDAGVGRWPARVLLGHLADAAIVNTHRMRRACAEDNPVLAVWDENAFIDGGLYGGGGGAGGGAYPIGGFLATIHTIRRWTANWLATLTPEQFARKAMHPERGPLSVRDMLVYDTWHLEHHAAYLNAKVEKMMGPAPAEDPENGGGCCGGGGHSCGCTH